MRRDVLLCLVLVLPLAVALTACRSHRAPATAETLALAAGDFPGLRRVEPIMSVVDSGAATPGPDEVDLRRLRLASAARVEYYLAAPSGAVIRAHLLLFVDEAAAQAHWRGRHHPASLALTQPLDVGDEAWIAGGKEAELRTGRVVIALQSREPYLRLADLARQSARHAEDRLEP